MNQGQNFNNLLFYIKSEIGYFNTPVKELTDNDIIKIITDVVLPEYSVYDPAYMLYLLSPQSTTITVDAGYTRYKIPIADLGINIINVDEIYWNSGSVGSVFFAGSSYYYTPTDTVILNRMFDILNSLNTVKTFNFVPPDTIVINSQIPQNLLALLNIVHKDLSTISPDLYHILFKKMALYHVIMAVVAQRNRYATLSTPFGEIQMGVDMLMNKAETLKSEINEVISNLPPKHVVYWMH